MRSGGETTRCPSERGAVLERDVTQAERVGAASRLRLVGWNPGMVAFGLGFVAFTVWLTSSYATGPATASDLLQGPLAWGAVAGGILEASTCRVRVGRGMVELTNILSVTSVPFHDIERIEALNGMSVVTRSGATHESVAYGGSLLAVLTGNKRAVRLQSRLSEAMISPTPGAEPSTSRRFRPGLVALPLLIGALELGYILVARSL